MEHFFYLRQSTFFLSIASLIVILNQRTIVAKRFRLVLGTLLKLVRGQLHVCKKEPQNTLSAVLLR